jgi:hypothetical protein
MLFNLIVYIFVRLIFPLSINMRSDGHIYIYTIRLNNMTPLKLRGKIRRAHINTKGEDQTDKYINNKIEQHDSTKTKGDLSV